MTMTATEAHLCKAIEALIKSIDHVVDALMNMPTEGPGLLEAEQQTRSARSALTSAEKEWALALAAGKGG